MDPLPPLRFQPLLKHRAWGGDRLGSIGREVPPGATIGESWDLADLPEEIPGGRSVVAEGPLAGTSLATLLARDPRRILGDRALAPTGGFPLLVKWLDARENLSIQVHPDPDYVASHPDAFVKNEAWFVVHAEPGAVVYRGIHADTTPEEFFAAAEGSGLLDHLEAIPVTSGDCVRLPSGLCHALGEGVLVAEIQTPSDTTFRVWDWDRRDPDRPLHLPEARACTRFGVRQQDGAPPVVRLDDVPAVERDGVAIRRVCTTDDFTIDHVRMPADAAVEIADDEAPRVLMALPSPAGPARATVEDRDGRSTRFIAGDTVLLPADVRGATVRSTTPLDWLWVDLPPVPASTRA